MQRILVVGSDQIRHAMIAVTERPHVRPATVSVAHGDAPSRRCGRPLVLRDVIELRDYGDVLYGGGVLAMIALGSGHAESFYRRALSRPMFSLDQVQALLLAERSRDAKCSVSRPCLKRCQQATPARGALCIRRLCLSVWCRVVAV